MRSVDFFFRCPKEGAILLGIGLPVIAGVVSALRRSLSFRFTSAGDSIVSDRSMGGGVLFGDSLSTIQLSWGL